MNTIRHNTRHVLLGIAMLLIPIAAFLYKLGASITLRTIAIVLGIYLIAKLAVYFFTRQNPAARVTAIALYPELIFILFLPKHLKQKLASLKENDKSANNI